jgi:hypothetical protein
MKHTLAITLLLACGASSAAPPEQKRPIQARDPMAIIGQPEVQVRPPLSSVKRKADQRPEEKPQTVARPEPKKVELKVDAEKRAHK